MKKNNALETQIKGLIAISSVNQLDLLGDVKNDILNSIDFGNYDINCKNLKFYQMVKNITFWLCHDANLVI